MNPRLLSYLRSIGLANDASEDQAWDFMQGLRGLQSSIANALNYQEADAQARTSCDLMLRALGVNPENPTEDATPPATPEPQRSGSDGASSMGDLEAARAEGAREAQQRVTQIRELASMAGTPEAVVSQLLDDATVTVEQARQRLFEEHVQRTRSHVTPEVPAGAPAGHVQNTLSGQTRESLTCALMMRAGIADPMRQWCDLDYTGRPDAVRELASDRDPELYRAMDMGNRIRGYSLVNIMQRALALDGVQCEPTVQSVVNASRSLVSTGEYIGIFTQTFGAILLQAFNEFPDTTSLWTVERDNPNFMQNERTRLKKGGELSLHGRGQTADHMDFSDITEPVKVNRYSGQFVVDEIDLTNDYFGALTGQQPQEIGRAARRIRPDLVYSILFANPALSSGTNLFDASHNNLHGTNALDIAGLQAALAAMQLQQENGVNLNLAGRYILIPPSLYWTGRELISSPVVVTGSDVIRPSMNALSGDNLTLVSEARLENGVTDPLSGTTHAGSSTDWYLAAEPGSGHTIEVTYLAGSARAPMMRSFALDRGQWGMGWDVKHDIGAAPLAYQGISKSTAT